MLIIRNYWKIVNQCTTQVKMLERKNQNLRTSYKVKQPKPTIFRKSNQSFLSFFSFPEFKRFYELSAFSLIYKNPETILFLPKR